MTIEGRGILPGALGAWRGLSLDAKVVAAVALGNWALLFANHTVVQVSRDAPLWQLFPGLWGPAWLLLCVLLALAYPLRDRWRGARFGGRDRVLHLAAIVAVFVIVPTVAEILLRATGKPYTYVHDGAIMVEEAARKLLAGQDPYVTHYLDTPLFYWPMINNPALYHLTYFPFLFLLAAPFVALFDRVGAFFDMRYLYLPAYVATLALLPLLIPGEAKPISARPGDVAGGAGDLATGSGGAPPTQRTTSKGNRRGGRPGSETPSPPAGASPGRALTYRLALVAIVALDPQLFPFVAEGRNDFFVLALLFAGVALIARERRTLGVLLVSLAAASKLHAGLLLPFVVAYLIWRDRPRAVREGVGTIVRAGWAGALVMATVLGPFVAWDVGAFWDDIVAYNAGGAAWSYPISGMGFSALLRALGVIAYPQQDFPFWAFQLIAALAIAAPSMRALRRDPSIATLLGAYGATLLAFLFFGRYFQGNYLGFIAAVAAPVPFLRPDLARRASDAVARFLRERPQAAAPSAARPVMAPVATPAAGGGSPAE